MPDKLHRCVEDVKSQGKSEKSAWAICNASLSKSSGKVDTKKSIEYRGSTFPGYNKPTKSNREGKKKMVLAKKGDKTKVIHYGDTHYKNNYSAEAKRSFRARHKCDQQKDKLTAAYWACKDLWPTGPIKKSMSSMDVYKAKKMSDNPCWEGYEMVGHKMKNGKKVPNCVPTSKKSAARKSFSLISGISNFSELPQVEKREFRISIPVPPSAASKIFMHDGIPMEDLSVDLAYIPPDVEMPLVRLIVSEFAKSIQSPLQLQTNGYGRILGDGEDTLYVSVDSPDLSFERERLIAVLSGNGIDVSSMHGFDPKIVIKTLYPEEPMPQFNEQGIVSWVANRIEICNGPYKYGYSTIFDTNQGVF